MLLRNENNSCKKQGGFSHFRTEGDQPTLNRRLKFPPKVNVRTAHMPYAKVVNFLDMERFHESLDGKLVVWFEIHRYNYAFNRLIINSLLQI